MADDKQEKPLELKPCPSNCGRTASPFKLRSGLAEGSTIILCECGWRTPAFTDPAHAAEMWNTRTDPAPAEQAERVARLEQIAEGLRSLDWVAGYELTSEQHGELDALRTLAFELLEPIGAQG